MGQRSRKRGRVGARAAGAPVAGEAPAPPGRGEARNAAIRSELEPLAPGERPGALTIAAVLAVVLALANLAAWAGGARLEGQGDSPVGVLLFAGLMLLAAYGMWAVRYWAVLGFQALLALSILIAAISLAVASNLAAVILCVAIIVPSGWLFWKLVRAMARIQMPERPGRR